MSKQRAPSRPAPSQPLAAPSRFHYNRYATAKTIATASLNVALVTNNASLLKEVIFGGRTNKLYEAMLTLLPVLLVLELITAILSLVLAFMKIDGKDNKSSQASAKRINYAILITAILTTVISIFTTVFGEEFSPINEHLVSSAPLNDTH